MKVLKVNSFTDSTDGGNPAGVMLNSPKLSNEIMMNISKQINVSETAYVFPSKVAVFKVRFFSPELEVDLCGHATIATFFTMGSYGIIKPTNDVVTVDQETKAGILPVDVYFKNNNCEKVMMSQQKPILKGIHLDYKKIANALNIDVSQIDNSFPEQIVSTGLFTLPVCIKSFEVLKSMKPDFSKILMICKQLNVGSFHVFTFDTLDKESTYHARNFAPLYGINEDPVTGTANGAVSSYLVKNKIVDSKKLICEQGDIIGRAGRVFVEIDNNIIKVGGKAKIVGEFEVNV